MNERIRKLAIESNLLRDNSTPSVETRHSKMNEDRLAKFAELIVQECITAVAESRETRQTAQYYRHKIAEHFGVE
jgi:hypothetical protein